jgi:hypothetical protein
VNRREAGRLAGEDSTRYGVYGDGALVLVSGYRNAKIVRGTSSKLILTASEIERVRAGWRP